MGYSTKSTNFTNITKKRIKREQTPSSTFKHWMLYPYQHLKLCSKRLDLARYTRCQERAISEKMLRIAE